MYSIQSEDGAAVASSETVIHVLIIDVTTCWLANASHQSRKEPECEHMLRDEESVANVKAVRLADTLDSLILTGVVFQCYPQC
jgi:hypothetical protein